MLKINPLSTLYVGIDVSSKSNYVCALDFFKNKIILRKQKRLYQAFSFSPYSLFPFFMIYFRRTKTIFSILFFLRHFSA